MSQKQVLQVAKQSREENRSLYKALASEKPIQSKKHAEEDIIDQLFSLLPKSTEGKIAVGIIGLLAYYSFFKK